MSVSSRYVDLIIPRGSNDFVQYVMRNTDIPVRNGAASLLTPSCY